MTVNIKNAPIVLSKNTWLGPAEALVSLVEFGDYQSEACARAEKIVREIMFLFDGRIRFNFRHFPLSQVNQHAMKAAEAAVAAAQYGKFWEMHELLFANRRQLGTISLKNYAREIGITDKRFLDKLVNSLYSWQVRDDLLDGLQLGVRDVPTFFINGEKIEGSVTKELLFQAIERQLAGLA